MNEVIDVANKIVNNDFFHSAMEWISKEFSEILFDLIIPCLFIFVLIPIWYHNSCVWFARRRVVKNPTEENARKVYKALSKFGVSIANYPDEWNKFRNMFYVINGSDKVPTKLSRRKVIRTRF